MLLESLPQTFVGLRNGLSLALVISVVAETFIGSQDGLGHRVFEAWLLFEMPRGYAAIFAADALGYGLNRPRDGIDLDGGDRTHRVIPRSRTRRLHAAAPRHCSRAAGHTPQKVQLASLPIVTCVRGTTPRFSRSVRDFRRPQSPHRKLACSLMDF
jgi:hypothetical protein